MMKKTLLFFTTLLLFLGVCYLTLQFVKDKVKKDLALPAILPASSPTPTGVSTQTLTESASLFVPYWSLTQRKIVGDYNPVIYFGITADTNGVDATDPGYQKLTSFTRQRITSSLLSLRLLDSKTNLAILESKKAQDQIVAQTIAVAKKYRFDGILLDFEVTSLPFDSVIKSSNAFLQSFSEQTKQHKLSFAIAVYGDQFYRVRPYDIKAVTKYADQVYVMAYDFHKASGNPGPNFPFTGHESYGYDFQKMTDDFLQFVPAEKLTIVFGMYGYDWQVNAKGTALATGKALSDKIITATLLDTCLYKNCTVTRNTSSQEAFVTYIDRDSTKHIVWFEDEPSVAKKKNYLKTRGISHFSYWAFSYF